MFKRILYIVLFVLCSIVAKAQFVAEVNYLARWDEVTGLTAPSVGQYKILGTFFDRDGRGYVPSDIIPDSNYYYIDALEREFKIMLVNSSSPFVIEVDPVGHDKAPAKGYGQLTQVTSNTKQYFVTGGVSPRLRAAILNKNILRLSQYIDAELDISQYIGDSLQPILRQPAEPASLLTFWKKIGDTVYLYAPYADHFEQIAYKFQIDSLGSLIEQDTFVSDSDIKANAGIVLTKLQDIPDQTLLGNGTGNTGPPDTIYLDTTLVILNDSLKVDTTLVATRAFVLNSVIADDQMATEVPYMGIPGIFNVDQALDSLFNQTITPGIDSVGEENIKQGTTFPFSVLDSIDAKHLFGNPNSVRDTLKQIAIDSSFRIYDDTLRLDTTDRIATKYDIAISGNTDDQTAVEVPYLYNGQANVKTALDSLFELTLGGDRITNNTLLDEDISSSADIQLTKLQDITKNRLLGRNNSTNGPPEQLTPGYGIYIDGLVVKIDTSEVSTLYYVTQKIADSTSNLRIVLGDSMTIIRNIAQQNFDSLEQTLADTALTLRGLITALSPANIDSIIREIDTLNAWVDTVNITTIWDTLTVHRIDINKNDSSILVNKANISVNYGLIQNNTTNIGIINLTLLDIQDTLTAHNNRLLALEALTDSISPPQFVDSIGWDGDTLALRLSDTSIVTKARLIIPNSDSLATFTIVDSIWTLTTADGLIFKDTFNQIYYDDSAIYDSLAAHLSLIFGNSTLIQANKTELLDSISAHRTKLGALETSIGVNRDTSTAIRSDLNNLINIVNALPLNNADSITSVTFTETDTTVEFRLQTIDGLDFRDTFALSVYDDAWIYDSLALSFARHITQGDTLIVHNTRINALYDSLATITGTDDQVASEVPYTNNGQTTTQTALDSLFNKDVILSASITSLDGRVTTLEGDVNVINDTLIAHNNRLIVLENKPDTVLKQGVDQFTFVADVLSLSLSDTNQVVQVTIPISTIDTIVTAFIYQDTIVRIQTNNDLFSIPVRVKKTILPLLYPIQDSIASYDTRITNNSNAIDAIDTRVSLNEADIAILQSGLALVTIKADNNEDSIMVHRTDINTLFSLIGSFTNNPDDSLLTFSSVDTIFTITTADGNTYTDTLRLSDIPILYDSISVHRGDLDSIFNILNTTGPTAPGDSIVSFITVTDSIVRITTHDGNIYNTTVGFTKYINIVLDSIAQHLTRIEGIEGDISVLQSAVAVNANNISKNLDSLVVHNTRINNNVDSINANKVRIAQNETDIVEVNDSLTAIRADVGANLDSIFSHRSVLNSILATLIINGDTLTQHGLDISILYGLINAIVADSTTSFTAVDSVLTITTADGNVFKDTLRLSELVAAFDSLAQHRTELDALASLSIVDEVADSIVTFEVLADSTLRITSFDGSVYNATVGFTKYINAIYDSLSVHWTQIAANRDSIISNEARILANEIDIAVAQSAIALHTFDIADLQDTVIIHNIRINELFDSNAAQRGDIDSLFNRSWVTDFRRDGNNLVLENDFNTYIVPDRVEVFDTVLYEGDYWDVPVSYLQDYRVLNISISSKSIFQGVDSVWFRLPEADTSMRFTQINVNNSYYSIGAGGDPSLNAQVRFNDLNVVYHFDIIGEAKTNLGNTLGDWLIDSVEYNDSQGKGFWYINNTSTVSEKFYLGLLQADYVIKYMPDIYPTPLSDGWSVYKRGSGTAANIYYRYENDTTYADQSNITVEVALDSLLAQQSRHTDSLARHRVEIDSIVTQAVNYTSLDTFFTNLGGTIDLRQLCKDYDLIDIKHRMLEVDVDSQITYILLDPADPDLRVKTIRFNGRSYNGQADAFLFDIEGTDEFWSFGDFTGRTSVQTSSGNSPAESYKIYRGQSYSPQKYWTPLEFKPVRSSQGVNNYYWFVDDGRLDSRFVEYDANGQTTATEALDSLFTRDFELSLLAESNTIINSRQDDSLAVHRTDLNTLFNKNHITDFYRTSDSIFINSEDSLFGILAAQLDFGNILYVNPNGNDLTAVKGDPLRPWSRIDSAYINASNGDLIYLQRASHLVNYRVYMENGKDFNLYAEAGTDIEVSDLYGFDWGPGDTLSYRIMGLGDWNLSGNSQGMLLQYDATALAKNVLIQANSVTHTANIKGFLVNVYGDGIEDGVILDINNVDGVKRVFELYNDGGETYDSLEFVANIRNLTLGAGSIIFAKDLYRTKISANIGSYNRIPTRVSDGYTPTNRLIELWGIMDSSQININIGTSEISRNENNFTADYDGGSGSLYFYTNFIPTNSKINIDIGTAVFHKQSLIRAFQFAPGAENFDVTFNAQNAEVYGEIFYPGSNIFTSNNCDNCGLYLDMNLKSDSTIFEIDDPMPMDLYLSGTYRTSSDNSSIIDFNADDTIHLDNVSFITDPSTTAISGTQGTVSTSGDAVVYSSVLDSDITILNKKNLDNSSLLSSKVNDFYRSGSYAILETTDSNYQVLIDTLNFGNVVYFSKSRGNNATAKRGDPNSPFEEPISAYAAMQDGDVMVGLTRDTFRYELGDNLGSSEFYISNGAFYISDASKEIDIEFFPGTVIECADEFVINQSRTGAFTERVRFVNASITKSNSANFYYYIAVYSDGPEIGKAEIYIPKADSLNAFTSDIQIQDCEYSVELEEVLFTNPGTSWMTIDIYPDRNSSVTNTIKVGYTNSDLYTNVQSNTSSIIHNLDYKVNVPTYNFIELNDFDNSRFNIVNSGKGPSTQIQNLDSCEVKVDAFYTALNESEAFITASIVDISNSNDNTFDYRISGRVPSNRFANLGNSSRNLINVEANLIQLGGTYSQFVEFLQMNANSDDNILNINNSRINTALSIIDEVGTTSKINFNNSIIEFADSNVVRGWNDTMSFYNSSIIYTGPGNPTSLFNENGKFVFSNSIVSDPLFDNQSAYDTYVEYISNESLEDALKVRNVTASGDHTLRFETKQSIHRSENTTQFTSDSTDINFIAINEGGTIRLQSDIIKIPNLDATNPTDSVYGLAAIVNGDTLRRMPLSDLASQLQDSTVFGDASLRLDTVLYQGQSWSPTAEFLSQYADVYISLKGTSLISTDSATLILPEADTILRKTTIYINNKSVSVNSYSAVYFNDSDVSYYFDIVDDIPVLPNPGIDGAQRGNFGSFIENGIDGIPSNERFYPSISGDYIIRFRDAPPPPFFATRGYSVYKEGSGVTGYNSYYNPSITGSSTIRSSGEAIDTLFLMVNDIEAVSSGLTRLDTVASNTDITLDSTTIANNGLILISHAEAISGIAASHSEITFPRADSTLSKTEIFIQAYDNDGTYDVRLIGDTFQLTGVNSEIVTLETATLYRIQAVRQPSVQSPNYVWRVDPLNGLVNANAVVYTNNGNTNVAQALDDLYSGGAASVELDSLLAKVDAETDDTLRILRPVKSQDISVLDNGQSVFFGDLNDSGRAGFKFQHATPSNGFYFYQASEGSGVFTSNSNIGGGGAQEDITKYSMYNIFDTPNGKFAWRMTPPGGSTYIDKMNIYVDSIANETGISIINDGTTGAQRMMMGDIGGAGQSGFRLTNPSATFSNTFYTGGTGDGALITNWNLLTGVQDDVTKHSQFFVMGTNFATPYFRYDFRQPGGSVWEKALYIYEDSISNWTGRYNLYNSTGNAHMNIFGNTQSTINLQSIGGFVNGEIVQSTSSLGANSNWNVEGATQDNAGYSSWRFNLHAVNDQFYLDRRPPGGGTGWEPILYAFPDKIENHTGKYEIFNPTGERTFVLQDSNTRTGLVMKEPGAIFENSIGQGNNGDFNFLSNWNIFKAAQGNIAEPSYTMQVDPNNDRILFSRMPPGGSSFSTLLGIYPDSISNWTGTSIIRGSSANLIFDTRENVSNPGYDNRLAVGSTGFNFSSNVANSAKQNNSYGATIFNGNGSNEEFKFWVFDAGNDPANVFLEPEILRIGADSVTTEVPFRAGGSAKIEGNLTVTGNITGTIAPSNITGFTDTTQVLRDSIEALKARIVALENPAPADTVASAATVNLNVTSKEQTFVITGTTNITTLNINNSINGGTITIIFQSNLDVTFPSTVIDLAAGDGTTGLGTVTTGGFKFITLFTHDSKYYGRQ